MRAGDAGAAAIWDALARVPDPELPFVSVVELGIVRALERVPEAAGAAAAARWRVVVTPTFSGCPATRVIEADIRAALDAVAPGACEVVTRLAPPWSTDAIAPEARRKLAAVGVAPPALRCAAGAPAGAAGGDAPAWRTVPAVACPRCGSARTTEVSHFGSTPCKAQFRCDDCLEPFDHFKPH
ncbi:MAG: phenylacetate-CoA oxygenase subunit PaaJ [Proteobacteria bacterium]|jgi:ring-1,2-phenylacetyl-CoA epoxidase subunit PaaD|nr:phenylacetate-CoA oxygenase subunit PaaJ [Pseudomonadota bacterium]